MFQSITPVQNTDGTELGRILPADIPQPPVPLNEAEHILSNAVTHKNRELTEGENMFVSLLTGQTLVGLVEYVDEDHFTVGSSDPIPDVLIESARVV